jgi:hypothetical protein
MNAIIVSTILFYIFMAVCWVVNLIKLIGCDFASPWKDEVIHAIGLFHFASIVTAWF